MIDHTIPFLTINIPLTYLAAGAFLKRGNSNLVRRKGPRWFVANCSSWPSLVLVKRKSGLIEAVHLLI